MTIAVDDGPVKEVTQPCNDLKTCLAGITQEPNLPVPVRSKVFSAQLSFLSQFYSAVRYIS